MVGAVRLLVLAHDELAHARGRLPVHGATVVARLVIAQGVEGHVGAGELTGGHALDVQLEAGRVEGHAHGARVHVQEDRLVPHAHAAQQAQRVRTHGSGGADADEAAVTRGDQEHLVPGLVGAQRGHDEFAGTRADRQFDDARTHGPRALVTHRDLADGRLTGDDALVRHADRHEVRGPPGDAQSRDQQRDGARERAGEGLDPFERDRDCQARNDEDDDRPADRRDRRGEGFQGLRRTGLRPAGRDHRGGVRALPCHRCVRSVPYAPTAGAGTEVRAR